MQGQVLVAGGEQISVVPEALHRRLETLTVHAMATSRDAAHRTALARANAD